MHPLNVMLECFGFHISRTRTGNRPPLGFKNNFETLWRKLPTVQSGWRLIKSFRFDGGSHPEIYQHFESAFAAEHLSKITGGEILDVGSYRHFVLGLMARSPITTIDVRERHPICSREIIVTCDAKKLDLRSNAFDAVVSLCALEHFGLGRYGDMFDLTADGQAFSEMVRVLKPGGRLIFSTLVTRGGPTIAFNAHRIYSLEIIQAFCQGLGLIEEKFYISQKNKFGPYEDVTTKLGEWDIYCGCWEKP